MSFFRKAVLQVGTYHSPDGTVEVTPARLQHWKTQVGRLQKAGYAIPMHWDHAGNDSVDLLEPIKMDTLRQNQARSARNTVGKLVSMDIAKDGKSAELTVQTLTPEATSKAQSNAVYVSPVLFSEWRDGAGNSYSDTIGSVDLVDYPVDHSQGPFVPVEQRRMSCVIRMSTSPKVFRLGENPFKKKKDGDGDGEYNESESSADSNSSGEKSEATDFTAGDEPAGSSGNETQNEVTSATSVSDVVGLLAQLQIMLPDDTTTANFLDRLRPALMTSISSKAQPQEPELATELPAEQPTQVDAPQIAAMSARIRELEKTQLESGRNGMRKRLDDCLRTGRITPHEHGVLSKRLATQKMSLTKSNEVRGGDVEVWIQSREATPKGSCWKADERVKRMATSVVDAPTQVEFSGKKQFSEEEIKQGVKLLTKSK